MLFREREEIALLTAQDESIRSIAPKLNSSPATISRDLCRNLATGAGRFDYRSSVAQWSAELLARRTKIINSESSCMTALHPSSNPAGSLSNHPQEGERQVTAIKFQMCSSWLHYAT